MMREKQRECKFFHGQRNFLRAVFLVIFAAVFFALCSLSVRALPKAAAVSDAADVSLKYEYAGAGDGRYAIVKGIDFDWADENIKGAAAVGVKIVIPKLHDGVPVKEIAEKAFKSDFDAFIIPPDSNDGRGSYYVKELDCSGAENLSVINADAFFSCLFLDSVDFSGLFSLTEIKKRAFAQCEQLEKLEFENCGALEKIGDGAFSYGGLTTVDFGGASMLTQIGDNAFSMNLLTQIKWNGLNSLESIGSGAFFLSNIHSLDFSVLPKLEFIGDSAFSFCANLTFVDLRAPKLSTLESYIFVDNESLKTVYIGNVSEVGEELFDGCPIEFIIADNPQTYALYTANGHNMAIYEAVLTYEFELAFSSSVKSFTSQTKLFNKPLNYVKGAGGLWAADANWALPSAGKTQGKLLSKWTWADGSEVTPQSIARESSCTAEWKAAPYEGLDGLQIALIVAGSIIIVLGVLAGVYVFLRTRKKNASAAAEKTPSEADTQLIKNEVERLFSEKEKTQQTLKGKGVPLPDCLTDSERHVAEAIFEGLARKEIAAKLFISNSTVNFHISNIFTKCECESVNEFLLKYKA